VSKSAYRQVSPSTKAWPPTNAVFDLPERGALGIVDTALDGRSYKYVPPKGGARAKPEELTKEITRFPRVCVRADRRSAIKSHAEPPRW
jgi:hypothetical protein